MLTRGDGTFRGHHAIPADPNGAGEGIHRMRRIATALLLISGFYTDAQLYAAKHAMAQDSQRRVVDYLQDGWVIKAAIAGPPRILVLQKDGNAKWCEMRDNPTPVTIKGVPQLFTASCSAVR